MKRMLFSTNEAAHQQHDAVRNTCGWYDFTHRLVKVSGPDACAFLDGQYAGGIAKTKVGRAKYTLQLDENGDIVDDVVVFRIAEDAFVISTFYSNALVKRVAERKGDLDFSYEVITDKWRMYSVQGPRSKELMDLVVDESVEGQRFFELRDNSVDGTPVKVARAGFTGEKWGFEIYVPIEDEATVVNKLAELGPQVDAKMVLSNDVKMFSLSCEAGYLLMMDMLGLNPFEVGNENTIDWSHDFVGKAALEKIREKGVRRQRVGFTQADNDALIAGASMFSPHGAHVILNGEDVGKATKYTHGFTVGTNIGYAVIDATKAKVGDHVTLNGYEAVLTEPKFI